MNCEVTPFQQVIALRLLCLSLQKNMQLVVHCNEALKEELASKGLQQGVEVAWAFEKVALLRYKEADAVIDLLFENDQSHIELLQQFDGLKIINSVSHTLGETDTSFVRINGWATFLKAQVIEASAVHEDLKKLAESVFALFNKSLEWLPDVPGFVVPRVVSLIINEAHFALAEGVSTPADIDTAMKLGTAYPYGPFEWSEKIGLQNIVHLLLKLRIQNSRYAPAPLLLQRAAI
jgi:3-hydroxybutyryl-CoA dehydrogenase